MMVMMVFQVCAAPGSCSALPMLPRGRSVPVRGSRGAAMRFKCRWWWRDDGDADDDGDGQDDVECCYLWHNSYKENYVTHTRKNMLWGKPRSGKHTVMYSVHLSIVVKLVSEKLKTLSKTIKIREKRLATASVSEVSSHVGKFKTQHIDDRSSVLVFIIWDRKIKKYPMKVYLYQQLFMTRTMKFLPHFCFYSVQNFFK